MLKFIGRPNRIVKCITNSLKIFPTSGSNIKLYCINVHKPYKNDNGGNNSFKFPTENRVVIYKSEKIKEFYKMGLLSALNYVIWTLFGISTYQLFNGSHEENEALKDPWLADEKVQVYTKRLIIGSFVLGTVLILTFWVYIMRWIKSITLLVNSREVLFETYTPIKITRSFVVPLKHVSGVTRRHTGKTYVPLKIKGRWFNFLVDLNGELVNPTAFDNFIALERDLAE